MEEKMEPQENMAIPREAEPENNPAMVIVDPDDPVLARFQQQLKNFYLARLKEMEEEMCDLVRISDEKIVEEKELEDRIHTQQNLVVKYRKELENLDVSCNDIKEEIQKTQINHSKSVDDYKAACEELEKQRKVEEELQKERQEISLQVIKLKQMQEVSSADSDTLKCVAKKVGIEKNLLESETYQLDLIINRLKDQLAVEKQKVDVFKAQCSAQEEESEDMRKFLTETECELTAIYIANQQLIATWKSTLEVLTDRHFCIANLQESIGKQNGAVLIANAELNKIKRNDIKEQLELNEQLMLKLKQTRADFNRANQKVDALAKRLNEVLDSSVLLQRSITALDKEYGIVNRECHESNRVFGDLRGEIQKVSSLCLGMEKELMKMAEENKYRNSATKVVYGKIKYWKNKIEEQQKANVEIENEASNVLLKVQNARINIPILQASKDELLKIVKENEEEQSGTEEEMQRRAHIMSSKRQRIIILKKELDELISVAGGTEISPAEREIENLKKGIADLMEEEAKIEIDCKKRQMEMICVSNELEDYYRELDSYSKELAALEETNKRMDAQINREKKELSEKEQNIQSIKRDIENFYSMVRDREHRCHGLRSEAIISENEWLNDIKKLNIEILQLEKKLEETHNHNLKLDKQTKDKEYEIAFWTRKLQMAEETRDVVTSSMHRSEMEEMKQTKHFLMRQIEDFERDSEMLEFELRKTLDTYGNLACRQDLKRKLANKKQSDKLYLQEQHIRRELVALNGAIKSTDKEIESLNNYGSNLQRKEEMLNQSIENLKKSISDIEEEIKEATIKRNRNVILINMKQHLSTYYQDIRDRRFQGAAKSVAEIQIRVNNIRKDFDEIRSICERLYQEFPVMSTKIEGIIDQIEVSKLL